MGSRWSRGQIICLFVFFVLMCKFVAILIHYSKYDNISVLKKDLAEWAKVSLLAIVDIIIFSLAWRVIKKTRWYKRKLIAKEEKRRCREELETQEIKPQKISVFDMVEFSSKEEEAVNLSFRNYVIVVDRIRRGQAHFEYLNMRFQALLKLGKKEEAEKTRREVVRWGDAIQEAKESLSKTFDSSWCNKALEISEIASEYSIFAENLPVGKVEWISAFFDGPKVKIVPTNPCVLIFTPLYVLVHVDLKQPLKLVKYCDLRVVSDTTSSLLSEAFTQNMEIDRIDDMSIIRIVLMYTMKGLFLLHRLCMLSSKAMTESRLGYAPRWQGTT